MAGGILAYDALMYHRVGLSRNPSSASGYSDITDISVSTIPEDDVRLIDCCHGDLQKRNSFNNVL